MKGWIGLLFELTKLIERDLRRKQSKCELCGKDLGSELIVLEEWQHAAKRLVYRGDEARKFLKPEQPKQCPTCGATDIKYAYIEDGSMGYWCYQCKKSLKAMKDPLYQERPHYLKEVYTVCPSCAETDIPSPKPAVTDIPSPKPAESVIILVIILGIFLIFPLYIFYIFYVENTTSRVTQEDGRFTAYSDGIVLDTKTGLEWISGPDEDTTGLKAKSWTEDLNRDEFSGGYWRMPTILELKTLYQDGVGRRNMTPLLKTTGWWVWSSEEKQGGDNRLLSRSLHFRKCIEDWRSQEIDYYEYGRAFAVRSKKEITNDPGSTKEVATHSEISGQQEIRRDGFFVSAHFAQAIPSRAKPVKFTFKGVVKSVHDYGESDLKRYFRTGKLYSAIEKSE